MSGLSPHRPPHYNFAQIPTVHGRDAFWIQKRGRVPTVPVAGGSDDEGHGIHLPQASYWPAVAALGLLIAGYGVIYHVAVAAIGAGITLISVYAWSFEPVNEPDDGSEHH